MKIGYYAIFNYELEDGGDYSIEIYFPDVPDAFTCAKNEEEAFKYAKEVLELVTADILVKDLPKRTELKDMVLQKGEKAFLIEYETSEVSITYF